MIFLAAVTGHWTQIAPIIVGDRLPIFPGFISAASQPAAAVTADTTSSGVTESSSPLILTSDFVIGRQILMLSSFLSRLRRRMARMVPTSALFFHWISRINLPVTDLLTYKSEISAFCRLIYFLATEINSAQVFLLPRATVIVTVALLGALICLLVASILGRLVSYPDWLGLVECRLGCCVLALLRVSCPKLLSRPRVW